ncbi:LysR family transcriptional regulator [Streptomyces hirsutus]|uniref:LysR family transcriptional regulator n=1 Tax=Streptomyces hirsutus TaxID=35620 RepID=UPI00367FF221
MTRAARSYIPCRVSNLAAQSHLRWHIGGTYAVLNIPLRPRGGASHQTAPRAADEAEALPSILRKAFTGPYARQRLSRCLAAQSHPTLTEAARDLGIHHSTLAIQLNRLEADLGHPLFERAERGTAMKLTRFGKRVAAAAQKIPAEEMPRR